MKATWKHISLVSCFCLLFSTAALGEAYERSRDDRDDVLGEDQDGTSRTEEYQEEFKSESGSGDSNSNSRTKL